MSTTRFLLGFVVVYGVLGSLAEVDATGRLGIAILACVLATALVVERVISRVGPAAAVRDLGFVRPGAGALLVAGGIALLLQGVYPLVARLTGAHLALKSGWPWLLVGIFAFHGLAEELVWRGYAFRRLREGRSFTRAAVLSMPLVAATHIPVIVSSGVAVGVAAIVVAATTSLPLARLFELGRHSLWAPAVLHTGIDSFKLVSVPDDAALTFSLTLAGASVVVPMLVFLRWPRRAIR